MIKKLSFVFLIFILSNKLNAQTPLFPFPHHVNFSSGTIKPNNRTQAELDKEVSNFYNLWKSNYLKKSCSFENQYYVEYINETAICVSEGQGYGMVIVAYMAGYDQSAQTIFDGLYNWYKSHPSNINPILMNWQQGIGCVSIGNDAATDGDMDIAYSLLLADKQWGSNGTINYLQEALKLINAIKQSEIYATVNSIQLGDWANGNAENEDDTRPSDFMFDHFRSFQNASSDTTWININNKCYNLVEIMQTNFSPNTGLLPDFIEDCDNNPHPAKANFLEGNEDGFYYYNSCRTPWHLGVDYLLNGDLRAKKACNLMNNWIRNHTSNNVENIFAGYKLDGTNISGNNYQDISFIAPFAVSACVNSENQKWLNDLWNYVVAEPIINGDYFSNTIKMLNMIVISGNYWTPENVTSSIIENPISENNINKIEAYPNPTVNYCNLTFNIKNSTNVVLYIYNNVGQLIIEKNLNFITIGKNSICLDFTNLQKGIYFCEISQKDEVIKGSFIVK
jgi:endo-1,4-beta-D-glucanase Y